MKKQKLIGLGKPKSWAIILDFDTKYCLWTLSAGTIHNGQIWPIGASFKWLWFGISIAYVGKD